MLALKLLRCVIFVFVLAFIQHKRLLNLKKAIQKITCRFPFLRIMDGKLSVFFFRNNGQKLWAQVKLLTYWTAIFKLETSIRHHICKYRNIFYVKHIESDIAEKYLKVLKKSSMIHIYSIFFFRITNQN